jgi:uncharacterized protein
MADDRMSSSARAKRQELVVFARYPQRGTVKTRLIPALGPEGAAALQHWMTLGLLIEARQLRARRGTNVILYFAGGSADAMRSLYGQDLAYVQQGDGDLGARLSRGVGQSFSRGADAVIVVGTDCPALTHQILSDAFEAMTDHDVILGPATDGGYYLIGLRRLHAELFQNIAWGTDCVLDQTQRAASALGLKVHLLETLSDVDRPEDLPACPENFRPATSNTRADVETAMSAGQSPTDRARLDNPARRS